MKISFDFDNCLTKESVFSLAKTYIYYCEENKHDVWIVTSRHEIITQGFGDNNDLYSIADVLGLRDKIIFTAHKLKAYFLADFDLHYDDNQNELDAIIASKIKCKGILV